MFHRRRHPRRRHQFGSYAHHGYHGRDEKRMGWLAFRAEALKQPEYRLKSGKPNEKKIHQAWTRYKKHGHLKPKAPGNWKSGLAALRAKIDAIAAGPRRKKGDRKHHKRKYSTSQKLRMAAAEIGRAQKALKRAIERANRAGDHKAVAKAKVADKKAGKAKVKAEAAHKKAARPSAPATAKADADKADRELAEALKAANEAHRKAKEAQAHNPWAEVARRAHESAMFPEAARLINRDPRKKTKAKKRSSAKHHTKKRSSAKHHTKKRSSAKKHHAKKRTSKKKSSSKQKTASKRFWTLYNAKRKSGMGPKAARKAAKAAYREKYARDFEHDYYGF